MRLGEWQTLLVSRSVPFGFYLCDIKDFGERGAKEVLLPGGEIPDETRIGKEVQVFLYKDSEDRPVATTKRPVLEAGGLALLKVSEVAKTGAFLDWGLPKDLFLPFREQTCRVKAGDSCLVTMYLDKSNRLCASMRVHDILSTDSPYGKDDEVTGTAFDRNPKYGLFVAVDNRFSALVPAQEDTANVRIGEAVKGRVTKVRPDGRLCLSLRHKAYLQIEEDAKAILLELERRGGSMPFTDQNTPEEIRSEFHMSKAAFKRAAGHLLKQKAVEYRGGNMILLDGR